MPAPLLFIVSRRQPELFDYLCRQFATEPDMKVLLDRRQGQRRQARPGASVDPERRRAERRRNLEVARQLLTMGYAIARAGGGSVSPPAGVP